MASSNNANVPMLTSFYGIQLYGKKFPSTEEELKNLPANERSVVDDVSKVFCTMYKNDKSYKLDHKKDDFVHSFCCEWYSYCSFTNEIWFWPACIGAGFILLNLISIVFLCLICRKKGGRSPGGLDVEEKEVEEIDNDD